MKFNAIGQMRACVAVAALCAAAFFAMPQVSAQAKTIQQLQEEAIAAEDAYEQAQQESDSLAAQIEQNETRVKEIEAQLPQKKARAASAIRATYRMQQAQQSLVMLLLGATNFSDLVDQAAYLDIIYKVNTKAIEDLKNDAVELANTKAALVIEKQKADEKTREAASALVKATSARESALAAMRANAAAAQAAYEAAQAGQAGASVQDNTSNVLNQSSSVTAGGNFTYVRASMYGVGDGFMYGTTASGDIVTPTSMGVAMRTMPLGTVIEISYNGRTVRAVVNDRGPFVGNRQIDLQPAVAAVLGFSGVGTVGYRVVS